MESLKDKIAFSRTSTCSFCIYLDSLHPHTYTYIDTYLHTSMQAVRFLGICFFAFGKQKRRVAAAAARARTQAEGRRQRNWDVFGNKDGAQMRSFFKYVFGTDFLLFVVPFRSPLASILDHCSSLFLILDFK